MSKVNQQDIDKLIELVGGRGNIATVSHCITRLRFVLTIRPSPNRKRLSSCAW